MTAKIFRIFILFVTMALFSNSVWSCQHPDSVFDNLDFGLYWFDGNNNCQKAIPGQSNPYFDPNKDVVIFIHGLQSGTATNLSRSSFNWSGSGGPDLAVSQFWHQRGYNTGILYWNQFADESDVAHAEAKVWTANGPRAMRWKDSSGEYNTGPSESVTDLFV